MTFEKPLCIYHGNCADGFTAAWVVDRALGGVDLYAGVYQEPPPDVTGRDVLIVDFSYKRSVLDEMAMQASTVVVLDHHKTAMEDLCHLPPPINGPYDPNAMLHRQRECNAPVALHALFDMSRSGAMLAWDYFNPSKPAPRLVQHVQDRDLWTFKLPGTREIQANLFSYEYSLERWDVLAAECEAAPEAMITVGAALERKRQKDVAELVKALCRRMVIAGHDVPVANLPYTLTSDAGHLMANGEAFAACYWDTPEGRVFSLRSTDDGMDVSEIAKKFGGGGHRHASGFRLAHGIDPR